MNDFAKKCREAAIAERKRLGSQALTGEQWDAVINEVFEREVKALAAKPSMVGDASDEAFLYSLEAMDAYREIDIRRELGKAQAWASVNGKAISRRRFVNWLNKVERPIATNGAHKGGSANRLYVEPKGWKDHAKALWPDADVHTLPWLEVSLTCRQTLLERIPQ